MGARFSRRRRPTADLAEEADEGIGDDEEECPDTDQSSSPPLTIAQYSTAGSLAKADPSQATLISFKNLPKFEPRKRSDSQVSEDTMSPANEHSTGLMQNGGALAGEGISEADDGDEASAYASESVTMLKTPFANENEERSSTGPSCQLDLRDAVCRVVARKYDLEDSWEVLRPLPKDDVPKGAKVTIKEGSKVSETSSSTSSQRSTPTSIRKSKFGKRVTDLVQNVDFTNLDPDVCVTLLRAPSLKMYAGLNAKLKTASPDWLCGFLDAHGLQTLLDGIDVMSSRHVTGLAEAMTLLECVICVRSIMNSVEGLDFITQSETYINQLVGGKFVFLLFLYVRA